MLIDKVAGITPGKLYHVNAIQKSQGYYKTATTNSSENVTPNTAVKTYAQAVLPNLVAGDTVHGSSGDIERKILVMVRRAHSNMPQHCIAS